MASHESPPFCDSVLDLGRLVLRFSELDPINPKSTKKPRFPCKQTLNSLGKILRSFALKGCGIWVWGPKDGCQGLLSCVMGFTV